jgi:hypothetical protein
MFTTEFIIWALCVLVINSYAVYVFVMTWFGVQDLIQMRAQDKLRAKFQARRDAEAAKAIRTAKLFS